VIGFPAQIKHRRVAATVANRGVTVWEGDTPGIGSSPLEGPISLYTKAAVGASAFESRYAALGADGKFGFWDGQRASKLEIEADQPPATDLDFGKDGNVLAVGHSDGSVSLWHPGDRFGRTPSKQAVKITDHGGPVVATTWSPDGKDLATVDRTGRVRVWGGMKIDPPGATPYQMKAP
jgi:WD40 repeat protein